MSEWKTYRLSELIHLVGGGTPKTTVTEYWNGEIPWLSVVDFGKGIKKVYQTEKSITEKGLNESSTKILKEGQIIISARGTVGELAVLGRDMAFNQSCYGIYANDKTENNFLYYLLKYSIGKIKKNTHGAVFDTITKQTFDNIEVAIPESKVTQTQIAQILTSLDDKIELNLQMNQTLEAMAQAIFKEWFVNFNFPGFDGELVDGLPKGWRIGVLGEMVDKLSKGTTPTQKDLGSLEVQIPFLKVKDISDIGTISKNNLELIPIEVHQNQLKRSILETNDILFSIAGTIGRVAIVDETLNFSNCNQAIAFIRLSDKNAFLEYIHLWLRSEAVQNNIKSSIVQGVQANVSLTVLNNIEVLIPNDETLNEWNNLIKPIYHRIRTTIYQIESLTQTRDTLLPKLMSGQLEIV